MGVSLKNKDNNSVCLDVMKDGDVAIIVKWGSVTAYLGKIVQRYENKLVVIGEDSGHSFDTVLTSKFANDEDYVVRILQRGEELVVD